MEIQGQNQSIPMTPTSSRRLAFLTSLEHVSDGLNFEQLKLARQELLSMLSKQAVDVGLNRFITFLKHHMSNPIPQDVLIEILKTIPVIESKVNNPALQNMESKIIHQLPQSMQRAWLEEQIQQLPPNIRHALALIQRMDPFRDKVWLEALTTNAPLPVLKPDNQERWQWNSVQDLDLDLKPHKLKRFADLLRPHSDPRLNLDYSKASLIKYIQNVLPEGSHDPPQHWLKAVTILKKVTNLGEDMNPDWHAFLTKSGKPPQKPWLDLLAMPNKARYSGIIRESSLEWLLREIGRSQPEPTSSDAKLTKTWKTWMDASPQIKAVLGVLERFQPKDLPNFVKFLNGSMPWNTTVEKELKMVWNQNDQLSLAAKKWDMDAIKTLFQQTKSWPLPNQLSMPRTEPILDLIEQLPQEDLKTSNSKLDLNTFLDKNTGDVKKIALFLKEKLPFFEQIRLLDIMVQSTKDDWNSVQLERVRNLMLQSDFEIKLSLLENIPEHLAKVIKTPGLNAYLELNQIFEENLSDPKQKIEWIARKATLLNWIELAIQAPSSKRISRVTQEMEKMIRWLLNPQLDETPQSLREQIQSQWRNVQEHFQDPKLQEKLQKWVENAIVRNDSEASFTEKTMGQNIQKHLNSMPLYFTWPLSKDGRDPSEHLYLPPNKERETWIWVTQLKSKKFGDLRIDLLAFRKSCVIHFWCDKDMASKRLTEKKHDLVDQIKKCGFEAQVFIQKNKTRAQSKPHQVIQNALKGIVNIEL